MVPGMPHFPGEDFINSFYPILIALVLGLILGFRNYMRGPKCPSPVRMDKKIVIVTGANCGIGYETAKNLAFRGAHVIMACRDNEKGQKAVDEIKKALSENCNLVFMKLDLTSMSSIREFVDLFNAKHSHLDLLVNNAGVMCHPQTKTVDEFEMHFQTNYLGHFMLTHLLLDKLKAAADGARVVNVIANVYRLGEINFDDMQFESREYKPGDAYSQSKLALLLFTRKLAKHLENTKVIVLAANPGVVRTNIHRYMPFRQNAIVSFTFAPIMWFLMKTAYDGAQTVVYCSLATEVANASGKCFSDCSEMEIEEKGKDDDVSNKLWNLSFHLCNIPVLQ